MKIEVHLLTHDAEQMLEWSLRHYMQFADTIVIHDGGPEGKSREKLIDLATGSEKLLTADRYNLMPGIHVKAWDTGGELNDQLAKDLKNTCWRGSDADFVICVDMDELIWAQEGLRRRLARAKAQGAAVLRPNGYEMFSDEWHEAAQFASHVQITDLVKDGCPDDKWYSKPCIFSPKLVAESGFGIGAHESRPVLKDGRVLVCDRQYPFAGDLALLHYKSIYGGLERIAQRYDATRQRLSQINQRMRWGNFDEGLRHATEKRERLLPGLRRVVA